MSVPILTIKDQRRLARLKSVMTATAPGYQHTYSVQRNNVANDGTYNLCVHAVPSIQDHEIDRLRNFAKGIIAGWECPE